MYCVKCGVELHDSLKECPLCGTPVYYPDRKEALAPYPEFRAIKERVNPRGIYFIISFAFLIASVISLICDLNLGGGMTWSGFVVGGLLLFYIILILPGWFRRPSPAVFVPCDFLAIAVYLFYVELVTEGDWFFGFALPIVGGTALIVSSVAILIYYLKRGYLYIWGGAIIAFGLLSVMIEILLYVNLGLQITLFWSPYPLAAMFLIGLMLIIIALVKPFRESLRKIFAL